MQLVTLDFETYYDVGFSLTSMTTEEYIRDPRFQVIGVGVKLNDQETTWTTGDAAKEKLQSIDWGNSALLCHNAIFDGAILSMVYGIVPALYLDTLCMARAIHGVDAGGSLAALVDRYSLGAKGTEVVEAKGKRLENFNDADLRQYGEYCKNDVELTYKLFGVFAPTFPEKEIKLIDLTLRMFTEPLLEVDDALLQERLNDVKEEKSQLLNALKSKLNCETEEEVRAKLASNKQFAELLEELGIPVPLKTSPTTGKETYALAKNDTGFIALTEHEDPFIQELCRVRLGTKSTIEESRIERFIQIGSRNRGRLPIPLKYYGAHTGRWAGSDKVNFQNLPSRDKKKKALKNAIVPPDGHIVINCDSSQIEARVLVWLAGQSDVVKQFAEGRDVYSEFASKVYERPITKADPVERFVGKTCIAEGTPVLCESGWKPIEQVTTDDKVWDGQEWVCHQGLLKNGLRETLNLCGIWLTPDHQVWSGTKWLEAQSIKQEPSILFQALDFAAVNLPLQDTCKEQKVESKVLLLNAIVGWMNTRWTRTTLKLSKVRDVIFVPSKRLMKNVTGFMLKPFQMTLTELDFLTDLQLQSRVATQNLVTTTYTMDRGESTFTKNGVIIERSFLDMLKHWTGGIIQNIKWTVSTITRGMSRVTFALSHRVKMLRTKEKSLSLKNVYDILNSGSKNRFTILTDAGPLVVHNCTLGLGYGTGWAKLQHTLKTSPPGADLTDDECQRLVKVYRDFNYKVIELWRASDEALQSIADWNPEHVPYYLGEHRCLEVSGKGIRLPNGLYIQYPDLHLDTSEVKSNYKYKSRKGLNTIWGGSVVENVVQALARIIVGEQMLEVAKRYRPVLTVHDAVVIVAPESEKDEAIKFIMEVMSTPPEWAKGLPVACEAGYGNSYGEC